MSSRTLIRTAATNILRNHFDTEASDAGLRSLDLASTGAKGSSSYDSSAVARADRSKFRGDENTHRRVRETLKRLAPKHVEILSLAYGNRLRTRDIEDGKKRRAVRQVERNWRVRLAELYGAEGLFVLASPLAQKLFSEHVQALRSRAETSLPELDERLATMRSQNRFDEVMESAEELLTRARGAVLSHESQAALGDASRASEGGIVAWLLDAGRTHTARIDADARRCLNEALDAFAEAHGITPPEPAPRHRSSERTRTRILANHHEHGQEIGR